MSYIDFVSLVVPDDHRVMRHVWKLAKIHVFPGKPAVFRAKKMRMTKICDGCIDEVSVIRVTLKTRNGVTRQRRTRKVRTPVLATVTATEEAAIFCRYINSFPVVRRDLYCRNRTNIKPRGRRMPALTVVRSPPDSI